PDHARPARPANRSAGPGLAGRWNRRVRTAPLGSAQSPGVEWDTTARLGAMLEYARERLTATGADSPGLTALVLLERATGVGRARVLAHPELPLETDEVADFRALVDRRCAREPLAYILGYREFFGRRFAVSPATLIP